MKFLGIIFLLFLFILFLIFFSSTELCIQNFRVTFGGKSVFDLDMNFVIKIRLRLFHFFTYFRFDITKKKIDKFFSKRKFNKILKKIETSNVKVDIRDLKKLRNLNLQIYDMNLIIDLSTEDAAVTSFLFGFLCTIISLPFKSYMCNNNMWKVNPIYSNENFFRLNLDGIFSIRLIHIIYTIYILNKKGEKYGSSNRRAHAHSYE